MVSASGGTRTTRSVTAITGAALVALIQLAGVSEVRADGFPHFPPPVYEGNGPFVKWPALAAGVVAGSVVGVVALVSYCPASVLYDRIRRRSADNVLGCAAIAGGYSFRIVTDAVATPLVPIRNSFRITDETEARAVLGRTVATFAQDKGAPAARRKVWHEIIATQVYDYRARVPGQSGTPYYVRLEPRWLDAERPTVRVCGSVDVGGWHRLTPLRACYLVAGDGTMREEPAS